MSTMELEARKSGLIRQVLDIDSDETLIKLEQYLRKVVHRQKESAAVAPMMCMTQHDFERYIQKTVDDDEVATEEEVSQFYEQRGCVK